ncbi:MAG: two-component regulator propeller domain-containing protein [Balneolaceae bacterium]|nr:two-component regulator propeller domain-containing protein [Balneolaceae bacterium]MDR9410309.1 two-component regulator propeller domain-containing protein [Balneolaceae bacterium]
MKIRFLILSLIAGFAFLQVAKAQYLPFRTYSIEVGLSESVAQALIQDQRGYIWVGTGYGLNRFDGVSFKQYYEDDGLASNDVHALFQDSEGTIWVGTEFGISILRGDTLVTPSSVSHLNEYPVISITEDQEGNFWFGTESNGAWILEKNGNLVSVNETMGISMQWVQTIYSASDGTIWIGSRGGLARINDDQVRYHSTENGLPDNRIRHITGDDFGRIWIGTFSGLVKYENGNLSIYDRSDGLLDEKIQTITVEDRNRVWLGTEIGVSLFDGRNFQNYTRAEGVPGTIVQSSLLDHEGNMWFGTLGGGMCIYVGDYFQSFNIENGLTNNVITGFAEGPNGDVWIATYGGGLLRHDGESFQPYDESDGLVDNIVFSFLLDSQNRFWIGTRGGISIYEDGQFNTVSPDRFPFGMVRKIYEDVEKDEYWIATYESGVIQLQEEGYIQHHTENGFLNNTVMDIKRDEQGNYWFATYGGVAMYDGEQFEYLTMAEGLPSNGVIHIHIDHNGDKWFSTFNGVAKYDGESIERLSQSEQIDLITYFTIQDLENQYWVGTNRGLYRLNPDELLEAENTLERLQSFRVYNKNQGLIANELNAGASYVASDGTIWLGTVEGLSHFYPSEIREINAPPGIEFEEVMVSGRMINPKGQHDFDNDENFVQISYSGLSYEAPDQIFYEYRMRGLDQGWQITTERTIRYPSLSPGEYEFQLRAYNADGFVSAKRARFSFDIAYPYYLQWWFFVLIILVIVGLILFSIRYFRIKKQVDIERMRVQIASDLHDDVGSSLTELALQTDFLQAVTSGDDVKKTLKQLGKHSRKIVSSLDDIVWSIDSRNDTAGDLTDRMQDYVNQVFVNGEVSVFYDFENLRMHEKLPVDVKENIYLIFKEAINNIVKHSNASRIDIRFSFSGKSYTLEIHDNGTKIKNDRKTGQGLRNMKMRADRIGSDVEIVSNGGFTIRATGSIK